MDRGDRKTDECTPSAEISNVHNSASPSALNQCRDKDAALAPVGYASISHDGARNPRY